MVEERERACDEDVLRGFDEPGTYAEAILAVCKLHSKTPLACMTGVASSNLRERIESIMNYQEPRHLNVGRRLVLIGLALLLVCGPLFLGMVRAGQLSTSAAAQSGFIPCSIFLGILFRGTCGGSTISDR
jgi:beta-lactamase regulating signal transducer with metallopeptidase domain